VQHVINTNPDGVAGPIRITTFTDGQSGFQARELPDTELAEHMQAIDSAADALRDWLADLQSGNAADVPAPPSAPAGPP
jgi:hypothetical protein